MIVSKDASEKIRILHLLQGLYMGGAENLVLHYIQALGSVNYDHFVYFFDYDGPIRKRFEALNVPVYGGLNKPNLDQPIRFFADLFSLFNDLVSFVKKNRIHIIQSHLTYANQLTVVVGKLLDLPAFPTVHNTKAFIDFRSRLNIRVYIRRLLNVFIYRIANRIIAVSDEIKGIVQQNFNINESNILVVKNGIFFEDNLIKSTFFENEFPTSRNVLKLISVGRLSYQKNFELLVKALDNVLKQGFKNFVLLIIGDGENRSTLENMVKELDLSSHIKILGIRDDVLELMKASDIFILPSRYEGLSIAMIEAMACGIPIIASDAPGLRAYFTNGQNGILFPVNDHNALAENIVRLANDDTLRNKLSCQSRKCFESEYNMRNNIKPLDSLFKLALPHLKYL